MFIDFETINDFNEEEWLDFYHDAREEFLAYEDANHAGNMKTRRFHHIH